MNQSTPESQCPFQWGIMTISNKNSWIELAKSYLFFAYFSVFYQLLVYFIVNSGSTGLRQAVYVSFLWLVPPLVWPACTRTYSAIVGIILFLVSLFSLGYFAIYQQDFSQSVLYIIFESNNVEASEYIDQYFAWWMIPLAIIYGLPALLLWKRLKPLVFSVPKSVAIVVFSLLISVVYPISKPLMNGVSWEGSVKKLQDKIEPSVPWQLVIGYTKYRHQLAAMNEYLIENRQVSKLKNFSDTNEGRDATIVMVIGESTNKARMSLYGYHRATTPRLDSIKDQLILFDNVLSTRPYTIEVLEQTLTFADEQHPDLYLKSPTIINMMKQAGYKTYWITNQQTLTERNTMLTTFSKQADEQVYLNNNRRQDARQFDEAVLQPFKEILQDGEKKKFVVIHLLGTHMKYKYRYPDSFSKFTSADGVPDWLNAKQRQLYNEYDNAVLYNDYVVSEIINELSGDKNAAFMLYFSDHGEEVFDSQERHFVGRSEGNPSSAMYTVPFVLWQSSAWRQSRNDEINSGVAARLYSTADFIYTWADLCGLKFDGFNPKKSIVNTGYVQQPVWIGDPANKSKLRDLVSKPFKVVN